VTEGCPPTKYKIKMEQTVQEFNKYKERGAYHWREMEVRSLKRYNAGLAARYNLSKDIIIRNCHNPRNVIDVGCGDGFFTTMLAEFYKDSTITGFDYNEAAIMLAKEKIKNLSLSNLSFVQGDAFKYAEKADLIVATDVIEHLNKSDEFMRNCFNILASRGYLFLSTPIRYKEFPDDKYHVHEFFRKELEDFSRSFGFTITVEQRCSHDYCFIEKYSRRIGFMGVGKIRMYKYLYNIFAIYFGHNVFEHPECALPTMHYILLARGSLTDPPLLRVSR